MQARSISCQEHYLLGKYSTLPKSRYVYSPVLLFVTFMLLVDTHVRWVDIVLTRNAEKCVANIK